MPARSSSPALVGRDADADVLAGALDAAARGTPGSGLGLAIVAQTAARHGGTVTTAPRAPHGTVVAVRLPVAR